MRTRENVHLTIPRQRILIRRQNSPVKCSRENVHQPRICAPNSLHFAHALHFAHGVQNLLLTFDCRSDWFWGFGTLPDLNLPRHKTSVLLTRLFHLVLSSNFRLSKKSRLARWDFRPPEPRPQTLTRIVSRVSRRTHRVSDLSNIGSASALPPSRFLLWDFGKRASSNSVKTAETALGEDKRGWGFCWLQLGLKLDLEFQISPR